MRLTSFTVSKYRYRNLEVDLRLSDAVCRNAKGSEEPFRITDGAGLYLLVQPNGSRLWRFDYTLEERRKAAALGKYP